MSRLNPYEQENKKNKLTPRTGLQSNDPLYKKLSQTLEYLRLNGIPNKPRLTYEIDRLRKKIEFREMKRDKYNSLNAQSIEEIIHSFSNP